MFFFYFFLYFFKIYYWRSQPVVSCKFGGNLYTYLIRVPMFSTFPRFGNSCNIVVNKFILPHFVSCNLLMKKRCTPWERVSILSLFNQYSKIRSSDTLITSIYMSNKCWYSNSKSFELVIMEWSMIHIAHGSYIPSPKPSSKQHSEVQWKIYRNFYWNPPKVFRMKSPFLSLFP